MRMLTIVTSLAVLVLAAAGTAGATAPTTTHQSFPRSIPHYLPCPGFWIDGEFQIDRTTTTFYNQDGTQIRTVMHVHSDGTLSNPLTGTSLADSGDFKITVDLLTGERTLDGKTSTLSSLADFVANLEASGYCAKPVEITNSEEEKAKDVDLIKFTVKATFEMPGAKKPAAPVAAGAAARRLAQ
jgi:hypothetical protein